jgi:hypothetical protein
MNRLGILAALGLLAACKGDPKVAPVDSAAPAGPVYPHLIATPDLLDVVRERKDRAPYDTVWAVVVEQSNEELRVPNPEDWDHSAHGTNARIAQAAAFIAWVDDDAEAADRAKAALDTLEAGIDLSDNWDLNIRLARPVMCGANAVDLLLGSGHATEAEADVWRTVIGDIGAQAYERWVVDDAMRQIALGFSQNNHPLRTAAAIGYAAMAAPDHEGAQERLDWAVSEYDYLLGPTGQYIQADGVVSEGPHYYGFGIGAVLPLLIGVENATNLGQAGVDETYVRNCINRQDVDPWEGHGCVDGEEFVFSNPLQDPVFISTSDWSLSQRLPTGHRPPRADSYLVSVNGIALLTHWGAPSYLAWDFVDNADAPFEMGKGMDLVPYHLLYADLPETREPPTWTSRFFVDGGEANFRSGWDEDARWLMLAAEHGAARKTLHDHVDGTSFQVAAYGDYLLVDTGYYKPVELDNAKTAHAPSHNVLLIDGQGAPDKGLLNNFGDTDAWLEGIVEEDAIEWADARMEFEQAELVRGVGMARGRYFVVADRLSTQVAEPREHRWRLHLNAGFDAGGDWWLDDEGPGLERDSGGLRVYLGSTDATPAFEEPPYTPLTAPHVHLFDGDREARDHAVVDGVVSGIAPGFLAVVAPFKVGAEDGADAPLDVQALDAGADAVAWRIRGVDFDDVVWLRGPGALNTLQVDERTLSSTDAVLWTALDGSDALIVE